MPYTTNTLQLYMVDVLGGVADELDLSGISMVEPAAEVELALGDLALADADDAIVRPVARREAWRRALTEAASMFDYSDTGSGSRSQSQLYKHCQEEFKRAQSEAAAALRLLANGVQRIGPYTGPVTIQVVR